MAKNKFYMWVLYCVLFCWCGSALAKTHYTHAKSHKTSTKKSRSFFSRRQPVNIPITGLQPNRDTTVFDHRVLALLQNWHLPGASITIMKNNQILLSHGYGYADLETQTPVQPYSRFRIASVSKAITAVAILQLVQQGKLHLSDHAYDLLNQLEPLNSESERAQIYQITLKNLLQMSSGWATSGSGSPDPMFGPWTLRMGRLLDYHMPPDCLTAARMMMSIPMQFKPGNSYSYSNLNYCMLGLIINHTSGMESDIGYQDYVRKNLLEPFGIYDMQIGDSDAALRLENEVKYYHSGGYDSGSVSGLPYSNTNILRKNFSDGGWVASSPSLAKFLQALQHHQILNEAMIEQMVEKPSFQQRPNAYFAMGWSVRYMRGHRYVFKTGSFTGTYALVVMSDDGTSYAALFNSKPYDRARFINQLQSILLSVS